MFKIGTVICPSRSVHNIRIERLWVDVGTGFASKWKDFFTDLEQCYELNVNSDFHLWLLHYLFLDLINDDILQWAQAWNHHPMRLPQGQRSGQTPWAQFLFGMVQHGLRGVRVQEEEDDAWRQDPDGFGVDWDAMDDAGIRDHFNDRRAPNTTNPFLDQAPPHYSRVQVSPPHNNESPLTVDELSQMTAYITERVPLAQDMETRKQYWVHALRFCAMVLNRPVQTGNGQQQHRGHHRGRGRGRGRGRARRHDQQGGHRRV